MDVVNIAFGECCEGRVTIISEIFFRTKWTIRPERRER